MSKLVWMLNRLRAMDPVEVAYRLRRAAQARLEQAGFGLAAPPTPELVEGRSWCFLSEESDPSRYLAAADRVLRGRFDVFSLRDVVLGFPPRWNRDPRTNTQAPTSFGKSIDYRDESLVGDVKYLWEPNRHLELVTLAQAWAYSREPRYGDALRLHVDSWIEQCPYPFGPNWTSSLESGIRLTNWAVAWQIIGGLDSPLFAGEPGMAFRSRWCRSIYQQLHFIAGHLSLHSSANNHLLGESMGLLVGALTWPMWADCRRWAEEAEKLFLAEALKQNYPDGVNRERAVYYQYAVIDMMFVAGLSAKANGVSFPAAYWDRIEKMLEFIVAIADARGNIPMLGDADDAVILGLNPEREHSVYRSILALGAVHFSRPDFAAAAGQIDDKTCWLMGPGARSTFTALLERGTHSANAPLRPPRQAFAAGGYWVLGHHWGTQGELRIVADAGELGYLSTAAHGHAGALACTLSVAGRPVLVDSGTYAYHTMKKWRDYFRGTSAHNTVRIDGVDQSVSGGNFLWLRHARAQCHGFESDAVEDRWVASHDGYTRLDDPVTHRRELRLSKAENRLLVIDAIEATAAHDVELFWHFAPECEVRIADGAASVRSGPVTVELSVTGIPFELEAVRGSEEPPLGWVSMRFDHKAPTTCLRWRGRITGSARWESAFVITVGDDGAAC